jgi:hypothetical protein
MTRAELLDLFQTIALILYGMAIYAHTRSNKHQERNTP